MSMLVVMVKTAAGPTAIGGFLRTSSCRNLFSDREINQQKRKVALLYVPWSKHGVWVIPKIMGWGEVLTPMKHHETRQLGQVLY